MIGTPESGLAKGAGTRAPDRHDRAEADARTEIKQPGEEPRIDRSEQEPRDRHAGAEQRGRKQRETDTRRLRDQRPLRRQSIGLAGQGRNVRSGG